MCDVLQVKQLRNRADEDARLVHMSLQIGSEPPSSLRKDLDHLMILVSLHDPTHPLSLVDLHGAFLLLYAVKVTSRLLAIYIAT